MTTTIALAAGATTVAVAFAASLIERWLVRRRPQELAWSVALVLFAAGSSSLWAGATLGWDPLTFRSFYAFGAVLNVPFLALGTVHLLARPQVARALTVVVTVAGAFAAGVIAAAPLTGPLDPAVLPQGSDVFGPLPRVLAALASGIGALVVFIGAAWSAIRAARGRARPRVALGNALIAAGTALLSASGLLNGVLGEMDAFAVTLTAGVTVLFAGFVVTSTPLEHAARLHAVEDRVA